jgi:hypothetical protein
MSYILIYEYVYRRAFSRRFSLNQRKVLQKIKFMVFWETEYLQPWTQLVVGHNWRLYFPLYKIRIPVI